VVYIAAPAVYQLRLRHGERYHYRFWGQLIRWAVARDLSQGSKTVKLATDRSRGSVGQSVQIVANLSDVGGQPVRDAEVRAQASINQTAAALVELKADPNIPGRYLGEYVPADEGTLTFQAFGTDVMQLLDEPRDRSDAVNGDRRYAGQRAAVASDRPAHARPGRSADRRAGAGGAHRSRPERDRRNGEVADLESLVIPGTDVRRSDSRMDDSQEDRTALNSNRRFPEEGD
jgi:hypothetical protein